MDTESDIESERSSVISDYEIEIESEVGIDNSVSNSSELDEFTPYIDEPLASREWVDDYEKEKEETAKLEESLTRRLEGVTPVSEWYETYAVIRLTI
ncbi:MAG: hypothetical protein DSY43_02715 [Gammaproteobacteria bacterium]|nr:MAG: hypothetical protein DSY43_02715 [Gammaproteobacteria bacterium]